MRRPLVVKIERTFGELIGDGMKIVFRHFKPMASLLLIYVMPFIAITLVLVISTGIHKQFLNPVLDMSENTLSKLMTSYTILGIGLGIAMVMMNLIVYCTIKAYYEYDGNVRAEHVSEYVKKYFLNYLGSVGIQLIAFCIIAGVVGLTLFISPGLFAFFYLIAIIIGCWIYNILQFIGIIRIEENLGVIEGINRCFYLIKNHWWETFGLIIVTSLIGSVMMYGVMMGIMIIIAFAGGLMQTSISENASVLLQIVLGVFAILYVLIMVCSNMYLAGVRALKYYDLIEKKEARNLILAIEGIGQKKDTFFENEGDF